MLAIISTDVANCVAHLSATKFVLWSVSLWHDKRRKKYCDGTYYCEVQLTWAARGDTRGKRRVSSVWGHAEPQCLMSLEWEHVGRSPNFIQLQHLNAELCDPRRCFLKDINYTSRGALNSKEGTSRKEKIRQPVETSQEQAFPFLQWSKPNDRSFATSYFITRLAKMSAALAVVAFSFMAGA